MLVTVKIIRVGEIFRRTFRRCRAMLGKLGRLRVRRILQSKQFVMLCITGASQHNGQQHTLTLQDTTFKFIVSGFGSKEDSVVL